MRRGGKGVGKEEGLDFEIDSGEILCGILLIPKFLDRELVDSSLVVHA